MAGQAGGSGENLTLRGIPEASLLPGVRLRIGTTEVEVTKPCDPCTELYALPYVGKERGPVFQGHQGAPRGWTPGVMAGEIHAGARVSLAPPTHT